jgi:hypothetical protein
MLELLDERKLVRDVHAVLLNLRKRNEGQGKSSFWMDLRMGRQEQWNKVRRSV